MSNRYLHHPPAMPLCIHPPLPCIHPRINLSVVTMRMVTHADLTVRPRAEIG